MSLLALGFFDGNWCDNPFLDDPASDHKNHTAIHPPAPSSNPQQVAAFNNTNELRESVRLENNSQATQAVEQHVDAFVNAFADGLDYVTQRYGSAPTAIFITKDATPYAYADAHNHSVTMSSGMIIGAMAQQAMVIPQLNNQQVNPNQAAFLMGVEEAAHVHLASSQTQQYKLLEQQQNALLQGNPQIPHNTLPLEQAIAPIIAQAAQDIGINTAPAPQVTQASWATDIAQMRNQQAVNKNPSL